MGWIFGNKLEPVTLFSLAERAPGAVPAGRFDPRSGWYEEDLGKSNPMGRTDNIKAVVRQWKESYSHGKRNSATKLRARRWGQNHFASPGRSGMVSEMP